MLVVIQRVGLIIGKLVLLRVVYCWGFAVRQTTRTLVSGKQQKQQMAYQISHGLIYIGWSDFQGNSAASGQRGEYDRISAGH